jgi:hypothetical protein
MKATIHADSERQPGGFHWYGALDHGRLLRWMTERNLTVPADLLELWLTFGGGEMFETEEILAPFGGPEYALDFDGRNATHHECGLPDTLFVFHEGTWLSAVRRFAPHYVTLDPVTYVVTGEFGSLDHWYKSTVRNEFAERYRLGDGPHEAA